jgi:hypothetical protein
MGIVEFILLMLACLGVTLTFVHMKIMDIIGLRPLWEKVNFFKELFRCSACTGWHVGLWFGISMFSLLHFGYILLFYICCLPFASQAFCYLLERWVILNDYKSVLVEKEVDKVINDDIVNDAKETIDTTLFIKPLDDF